MKGRWLTSESSRSPLRAAIALMAVLAVSPAATALIVDGALNTTVNPATYPGWTQGDPGWANVTHTGANYVYLGDGWVLSARHVGVSAVHLGNGVFNPIPGQNYVVHNPTSMGLTQETDLRLIRINGDPGLPSLRIATQSPPLAGTSGSQIVVIGQGQTRQTSLTNWNVNTTDPKNWIWTETTGTGTHQGYKTDDPRTKRWGTNRIASTSSYSDSLDQVLTSTTGVLKLKTGDQITRDIISMIMSFEKPGQTGVTTYESQAVAGNSGSAVFYRRGNQWKLSGILNAVLTFEDQPALTGVYGNATTFSDLSYYNQPYQNSICDIMMSCGSYSAIGDVNLDGIVAGNGTGPWWSDDVSAFVQGWMYDNGSGKGNFQSWVQGDLNLDGRTDIADFLLLRGALNGSLSSGAFAQMVGVTAIPEPSAAVLLLAGVALVAGRRRPRRR